MERYVVKMRTLMGQWVALYSLDDEADAVCCAHEEELEESAGCGWNSSEYGVFDSETGMRIY